MAFFTRVISAYSYALFYPAQINLVFQRYYIGGTSQWSSWTLVGSANGTTANRPNYLDIGDMYFDKSLGKAIWVKVKSIKEVCTLTITNGRSHNR